MALKPSVKSAPQAPATVGAKKSARKVTVACKIPMGVVLQLCRKVPYVEHTQAGTVVERERWDRFGAKVKVNGTSYPVIPPKGYKERVAQTSGFALTRGVDAEMWDEWLKQHAEDAMVVNNLIYAFPDEESVVDFGRDFAGIKSDLGPLDMDTLDKDGRVLDPRVPRSLDSAVQDVTTGVVD